MSGKLGSKERDLILVLQSLRRPGAGSPGGLCKDSELEYCVGRAELTVLMEMEMKATMWPHPVKAPHLVLLILVGRILPPTDHQASLWSVILLDTYLRMASIFRCKYL